MIRLQLTTVIVALFIAGCNFPSEEKIDVSYAAPIISTASLSPKRINTSRLPPDTNSYFDAALTFTAGVTDADGPADITAVTATLISPAGRIVLEALALGGGNVALMPPPQTNSGWYTANVTVRFSKYELGTFVVSLQAVDKAGQRSAAMAVPLTIERSENYRPVLSNLQMPDTIIVPTGTTSNLVLMTVAASDSNGLDDIVSVTVTLFREDSSIVNTYTLFDDGGKGNRPPFNLPSGDATPGDGVYALTLPVPNTTLRNIYRDFVFRATDQPGAVSDPLTKRVYFK